ncbi:YhgE/Pip domain-containing protein [Caproiciproducens galactitolivorans]|uniref:Chromosome partition protein Smc n=1 Tax=Caproiciproducens galactitolivorans TaxID=642589 RepID=A0A4Z0Y3L5_9FIRM|nr:YhgE/Pip domain-containing protein [Caproiciproducens galactitolivorans]QEY35706.1 YhgE/Pip domain-containing protein [Caproiciproducens galactitolivorans]TGJ77437.1 chromosome partition protein Smc [Caproiciproducens galactitolivorans]
MNFRNIKKVYRQDWKRISKNPVAIVILAGLCVLPSLYAWVNIKACWNVYENTEEISVAVVNNDKGDIYKDEEINVGDEIVEELKQNNKIKWIFTNSNDANLGLIDSTYYAMIEIPPDFSSKFLTVLTDTPQKPQIIYKVDTKANPVAGKITATASNTLVEKVSAEFISSVNESAFTTLNRIGESADDNKETVLKVKDYIIQLNRYMDVITNSLDNIGTNSDNLNVFLKSIGDTMPAIQSSLDAIGTNNSDKQKIIQSMQTAVNTAIENVDLNLKHTQTSNTKVKELFASLNESVSSANASKINTTLPMISAQLDSMDDSIDATIRYLNQCSSYDYDTGIDSAITSLTKLQASLKNLRKSLADLQDQLKKASGSVDMILKILDAKILQLEKDLDAVDAALRVVIIQLENLNQTLQNPYLAQAINAMKAIQQSGLKEALKAILEDLRTSEKTVQVALKELNEVLTRAQQQIDYANTKIGTAVTYLNSVISSNEKKKDQMERMVKHLRAVKSYITDQQNQISNVQSQLNSANSIAKKTADLLNDDCNRISSQLNSALSLYNSGIKNDLKSIGDNAIVALKDSSALIENAQDLSRLITSMVKTAEEGSSLSSEFSSKINDKLDEFKDIISTLGSKFEQVNNDDIIEIISILQNDPQLMGNYISEPFEIKEEQIYSIPNYGTGMAPIYTTLALWVGCLVLNSILRTEVAPFDGIERLSLREKHFGKMLLFVNLAAVQGLIISLGDIFLLKIQVVNPTLFVTFCVFSSIVFAIITFTLASTLGNVGKALSIIYLILQVAGSGGSYPIQVDPLIFRILQPLFPFTYTLGGIREAIAGPLPSSVITNFALLTIFAAVFLIGGYLTVEPLNNTFHQFECDFKKSGLGE